jgi:sulfatase-like protein
LTLRPGKIDWQRLIAPTLLLLSIAGLNLALAFQNVWPTLWARPTVEISLELVVVLLLLAVWGEWLGAVPRWLRRLAIAGIGLLILGRYADVTAHALFGRPINLYFDLAHLPNVMAMTAEARSVSDLILFAGAVFVVVSVAAVGVWLAVRTVADAMRNPVPRRCVIVIACVVLTVFAVGQGRDSTAINKRYALPIAPVYAKQVRFAANALAGVGPSTDFMKVDVVTSDLARLKNGDVFVFFLESYGAVAHTNAGISRAVIPRLKRLQDKLGADGWHMASAFLTSPTFGGASWLAHSSFLSGLTVSQNQDYQLLLSTRRPTMVDVFRKAGYRSVALLPGIKRAWPEGAYYGYDRVYDAPSLNYAGPDFGWWSIPDQFALERMYRNEVAPAGRSPLFVVFPTVMSHMPFGPVPPYIDDWAQVSETGAYRDDVPEAAGAEHDWKRLRTSYGRALAYNLDMVEGFMRYRSPRNAFVVVIGDHQPPAIVSGPKADWQVPVHIFTRTAEVLDRFVRAGLRRGAIPQGASLAKMAQFHGIILKTLHGGDG